MNRNQEVTKLGAALMLLVMAGILTAIFGGIGLALYGVYRLVSGLF